jgi:hypothetical protein
MNVRAYVRNGGESNFWPTLELEVGPGQCNPSAIELTAERGETVVRLVLTRAQTAELVAKLSSTLAQSMATREVVPMK